LFSATRSFKLIFQADGNLVLYVIDDASLPVDITQGQYSRAVWATGTNGMGAVRCVMQADGNLVLYTGTIKAPPLPTVPPSQARPPGNGLGSNSNYFMGGSKPLLGFEVNIIVEEEIKPVSVAAEPGTAVWASGTDGHPGAFLRCQDDGNLVIIGPNGAVIASSNTYAGMG
jgi:pseudomonalisin